MSEFSKFIFFHILRHILIALKVNLCSYHIIKCILYPSPNWAFLLNPMFIYILRIWLISPPLPLHWFSFFLHIVQVCLLCNFLWHCHWSQTFWNTCMVFSEAYFLSFPQHIHQIQQLEVQIVFLFLFLIFFLFTLSLDKCFVVSVLCWLLDFYAHLLFLFIAII